MSPAGASLAVPTPKLPNTSSLRVDSLPGVHAAWDQQPGQTRESPTRRARGWAVRCPAAFGPIPGHRPNGTPPANFREARQGPRGHVPPLGRCTHMSTPPTEARQPPLTAEVPAMRRAAPEPLSGSTQPPTVEHDRVVTQTPSPRPESNGCRGRAALQTPRQGAPDSCAVCAPRSH